jgi:hypothetical protein
MMGSKHEESPGPSDAVSQMEVPEALSAIRSWRPSWRLNSPWAAGFLLLLAYIAVSIGTVLFVKHWVDPSLRVMAVAAPWLAVGVGVAGVLLGGARLWPALFVGSWFVWGVFVRDAPITVTVDAVAEAGSIVLIVHLLRIWGFHRSFDRFRDPLILLAAATVGRILAVVLDWVGAFVAGWLTPEAFSPMYRAVLTDATGAFPALTPDVFSASVGWSLNSIAGIMLVVPLASATLEGPQKTYQRRSISLLALCFSLVAWSVAALNLPAAWETPLLVTALMLVAWASVRFEPAAAAFATLRCRWWRRPAWPCGWGRSPQAARSTTSGCNGGSLRCSRSRACRSPHYSPNGAATFGS